MENYIYLQAQFVWTGFSVASLYDLVYQKMLMQYSSTVIRNVLAAERFESSWKQILHTLLSCLFFHNTQKWQGILK